MFLLDIASVINLSTLFMILIGMVKRLNERGKPPRRYLSGTASNFCSAGVINGDTVGLRRKIFLESSNYDERGSSVPYIQPIDLVILHHVSPN